VTPAASLTAMEPDTDDPVTLAADVAGRRMFWRSQLVGWPVFGVVFFLAVLPTTDGDPGRLLAFKLMWSLTGLLVSTMLAGLYRALRLAQRPPALALGAAAVVASTSGILWVLGLGAVARGMGHPSMVYTDESLVFVGLNHAFILLAWSGAYLTLSYWRRFELEQRKSLAAMGLAREAQLEMLRYQLNPHFLFNAMTSVRALITENPAHARETLTRLSDFLRYTLTRRVGTTVSVAEEMQIIRDYLAIEKVRFEERLAVDVQLDPCAAEERIPGFLLHSLVENAIKHGALSDGALSVAVLADCSGQALQLVVTNTGRFAPPADLRGHLGLNNVRQRLAATYPGRHTFTVEQRGGLVEAMVAIDLVPGSGRGS